jgi:septal ring factor EnvC (AmiA/AmiB activator)
MRLLEYIIIILFLIYFSCNIISKTNNNIKENFPFINSNKFKKLPNEAKKEMLQKKLKKIKKKIDSLIMRRKKLLDEHSKKIQHIDKIKKDNEKLIQKKINKLLKHRKQLLNEYSKLTEALLIKQIKQTPNQEIL